MGKQSCPSPCSGSRGMPENFRQNAPSPPARYHHSSEAGALPHVSSTAEGTPSRAVPDGVGAAAATRVDSQPGEAGGRCRTRKGTATVGAGSPGARGGGTGTRASRQPSERGGAAAASPHSVSSRLSSRGQASVRRLVTRRRTRSPAPWRRAKAVPTPLRAAPPRAAPDSQRPRGARGVDQVSKRSESWGRGLNAATSNTASRGVSEGSNNQRRTLMAEGRAVLASGGGHPIQGQDCQRAGSRGNPPSPPGFGAGDTTPARGGRCAPPPPPEW